MGAEKAKCIFLVTFSYPVAEFSVITGKTASSPSSPENALCKGKGAGNDDGLLEDLLIPCSDLPKQAVENVLLH